MKKFLATVMALTCAMVMLCSAALAVDVNTTIEDEFVAGSGADGFAYDFSLIGKSPADIVSVEVTFTAGDISQGFGGGFCLNTWVDGFGWASTEWGNEGSSKTITAVATGVENEYKMSLDTTGAFAGTGAAEEGVYNKIVIQQWWGEPITVTKVVAYDAAGNVYHQAPAAAAPTPEAGTTEEAPQTGDAMNIVVLAALAVVALGGMVLCVSKKNA